MRSHFLSDLIPKDHYFFEVDDTLHHLLRVVRLQKGEDLLLINGKGLKVLTLVEEISKKELKLTTKTIINAIRPYNIDLALGMPKRDALELCLKQATELGFENIYLLKSDFSQIKYPEKDRSEKLLIAAAEQSNASYLPSLSFEDWKSIPWSNYQEILVLDSQSQASSLPSFAKDTRKLLIVGPEGGFSSGELDYLFSKKEIKIINLPTPILRTPTAVAVGAGLLIHSLLN
jgi:16S rRNA (uracil1498-N3)-methyltransferase